MFGLPLPIDIRIVKENAAEMARSIKNVITPVVIRRNRLDLKFDFEYKKKLKIYRKLMTLKNSSLNYRRRS